MDRKNLTLLSVGEGAKRPSQGYSLPAFAPIQSLAFEQFTKIPDKTSCEPGTVLLEQDEEAHSVYLLRGGLVKLVYANEEGRQVTLGLRAAGWYAGAASVMSKSSCLYSVVAITPCIVSRIDAAEFPNALMQSAKMMRHFVSTMCQELMSQAYTQVQAMSSSAGNRLDQFMRERQYSGTGWNAVDTLPMLKQMEVAELLAITPEHLSRLLRKAV